MFDIDLDALETALQARARVNLHARFYRDGVKVCPLKSSLFLAFSRWFQFKSLTFSAFLLDSWRSTGAPTSASNRSNTVSFSACNDASRVSRDVSEAIDFSQASRCAHSLPTLPIASVHAHTSAYLTNWRAPRLVSLLTRPRARHTFLLARCA